MYAPFLKTTLEHAAELALQKYKKVSISVKPEDNNQVLTEADIVIGQYIVEAIERGYPGHNIIDEEAGVFDKGSAVTWVVDPIDGTSNFAAGTPLYGCMVGVLENDVPVAGGVVLPGLNELYLAQKGQGATCNGDPIHVSPVTELKNALIAYGIDGHQESPELTLGEVQVLGSIILAIRNLRTSNSAYDMMMAARGSYGAYLNKTSKIWDNVAPQIITEEAGGIYTDFYGKPIDYRDALVRADANFTACAGAPALHLALQEIINKP